MNESQLCELLGRKQFALERLDAEYTNLINLLSRIKAGEVDVANVMIDLKARSWTLAVYQVEQPEAIKERMNGDLANAGHDG